MTKNLPVKYGLIPILDFDSIIGRICVKNIRTVAYAVSKCYILSDTTTYHEDGSSTKKYEVAFPYHEIYMDEKVKLIENNIDEDDCSTIILKDVYDDYETAKKACIKKNSLLVDKEDISYTTRIEKKIESTEEKLKIATKQMKIGTRKIS